MAEARVRAFEDERIRVLHVITRLVVGGAQENTLLTVARLDHAYYNITLASGPAIGPEGSLEDQISPAFPFERLPELMRDPDPVKDLLALRRLYALMRRDRYHIVHTHTTKAGILGRIAARLARVPIVVHTPHGHAFHSYLSRAGSETLMRIERWLARRTHRIICLSEAERRDYLHFRIASPGQLEVIHSGVDLQRFGETRVNPDLKRRALGLPLKGPLVGCVARLVPVKGVECLLEAVVPIRDAVPQVTVVFVGDGPLRAMLEQRAATAGLDGAVAFLGRRRDIAEIMPLFDVVVVPSLNEGMGRAAIEALAAGRPVVGSQVGGIQDIIVDGVTGLLVSPGDPEALARAIVRCLSDQGLARALGLRGRDAIAKYGIDSMIAKIDQLYVRLLEMKGLAPRCSPAKRIAARI